MGFVLLEWAFRGIDMKLLVFPDGFQALILPRGVALCLGSRISQATSNKGSNINNMELTDCSHSPDIHVGVDVVNDE